MPTLHHQGRVTWGGKGQRYPYLYPRERLLTKLMQVEEGKKKKECLLHSNQEGHRGGRDRLILHILLEEEKKKKKEKKKRRLKIFLAPRKRRVWGWKMRSPTYKLRKKNKHSHRRKKKEKYMGSRSSGTESVKKQETCLYMPPFCKRGGKKRRPSVSSPPTKEGTQKRRFTQLPTEGRKKERPRKHGKPMRRRTRG